MWATDRLVIEPLAVDHAAGLLTALDDPRVGEYIGGPDVTTLDALEARIRRLHDGPPPARPDERWVNHVVRLAHDRTVIGRLEATTHPDWAEVAYVFGPAWWGAGYATEALTWFVDHLAQPELWAAVHPDNSRSCRLLERVGFTRVVDTAGRDVSSYDPGDLLYVRNR